jgi:hypothetical protein
LQRKLYLSLIGHHRVDPPAVVKLIDCVSVEMDGSGLDLCEPFWPWDLGYALLQ